jgi:hypothetical protein
MFFTRKWEKPPSIFCVVWVLLLISPWPKRVAANLRSMLASTDIELQLAVGVHGPKELYLVLVNESLVEE